MKVITKIEVIETTSDILEIEKLCMDPLVSYVDFKGTPVDVRSVREYIRGRRFYYPCWGIDVVLGVSQEVGDLLGIQYETFNNLSEEVAHLRIERNSLREELVNISQYGLWKRLKCLFTGIHTSFSKKYKY